MVLFNAMSLSPLVYPKQNEPEDEVGNEPETGTEKEVDIESENGPEKGLEKEPGAETKREPQYHLQVPSDHSPEQQPGFTNRLFLCVQQTVSVGPWSASTPHEARFAMPQRGIYHS
ncbi:MAG: hypothetical protein Q9173_006042 [Seirophora scorigena]